MNASHRVFPTRMLLFRSAFVRVELVITIMCSLFAGVLAITGRTSSAQAAALVALPASVVPQVANARLLGHYQTWGNRPPSLTIGLLLAPAHQEQMHALEKQLYAPASPLYHHWLRTGEFDKRFGPTSTQLTVAENFLQRAGLHPWPASPGDLIILATGTLKQVEVAFHTRVNDYQLSDGTPFYANSSAVRLPVDLSQMIQGVLGLTNLSTPRSLLSLSAAQTASTRSVSPLYGGGPRGYGLTPSQISGIYNAGPVYSHLHTGGQGVVLGLFELSDYTASDIEIYERQFHLPAVRVEKRPIYPFISHRYASEVELDIEMQIALAPNIDKVLVYEAPATEAGAVKEYQQIAMDNIVDGLSISWGSCESSVSPAVANAEAQIFQKMLLQGQSVFAASGDSGAIGCLYPAGDRSLQVVDPASQPYVTAVGGTSFIRTSYSPAFDPGHNLNPTYPFEKEHGWPGSGGGNSRLWSRPDYQKGPGVDEPQYSQYGAWCGQSPATACREVPDVSLNADPASGYTIYCRDSGDAFCSANSFGWFKVGGTSSSAPLWSALAALTDSYNKGRVGLLNPQLYALDSPAGYAGRLHDITRGYNNDGLYYARGYPAGPFYNMVTGLGTPDIYQLVQYLATAATPSG